MIHENPQKDNLELAEQLFFARDVADSDLQDYLQTVALSDISDRDKLWDAHRQTTELVSHVFQKNPEFAKYAQRTDDCSGFLRFGVADGKWKLKEAHFCHVRHCPICQWRKSLYRKYQMYQACEKLLERYPKHRWVFMTLTVKNPHISDLRAELKHMNNAFKKLTKRKEFACVDGWIRTTEVTRPKQEVTDPLVLATRQDLLEKNGKIFGVCPTYGNTHAHPHFHILLMVKPSYFAKGYVKHAQWQQVWAECLGVNYLPMVDIRAVKPKKGANDVSPLTQLQDVLAEIVKYATKTSDWLGNYNDPKANEWSYEYCRQTKGMNFFATGGAIKIALQEIKNNKADAPDEKISDENMIYFSDKSDEKKSENSDGVDDGEKNFGNADDGRRWHFNFVKQEKIGKGRYFFNSNQTGFLRKRE